MHRLREYSGGKESPRSAWVFGTHSARSTPTIGIAESIPALVDVARTDAAPGSIA